MSEDRPDKQFREKRKKCRHASNNKLFREKSGQPQCGKCKDKIFWVYCIDCGCRLGVICGCSII